MSLFIGNISRELRPRDLEDELSRFGRMNMENKGTFGFCEFDEERDAEDCIRAMHGKDFYGAALTVEWGKRSRNYNPNTARRSEVRSCYTCGEPGHFARDCRGRGRGGGGGYRRDRSRSRSRDRYRRRSRSPPRRSRSRSRDRARRRDSRSPPRRDSRSPPRRRSRSDSRDRRRGASPARDASPPPRRDASPERRRSRSRSRSASPVKRSRSRSGSPAARGDDVVEEGTKDAEVETSKPVNGSASSPARGSGDDDDKVVEEAAAPEQANGDDSSGDLDVSKMKVTELREELTKRGLDTKGLKADLVQRLQDAM